MKLWNLEISDFAANLRAHDGAVTCVGVAPDEAFVASGSADRSVKIWSVTMTCVVTDYRVLVSLFYFTLLCCLVYVAVVVINQRTIFSYRFCDQCKQQYNRDSLPDSVRSSDIPPAR